MKELKIVLSKEMLQKSLDFELPTQTLYIDRSKVGDIKERGHNLIGFSRRELIIREFIVKLASNGFFLVSSLKGNSRFEKFIKAEDFKDNIKVKNLKIYNNIYYTIQEPILKFSKPRLVVIFSSVADRAFNADISIRNFFTNFETISKYIPQNSYILRIADIGGIIGNFYMNTTFSNSIENNIQELLKYILDIYYIDKDDVILYGGSKGGTASLYHSILGGYKAIAVDPIVSDKYHEKYSDDSHFTKRYGEYAIYPKSKKEKFINLIRNSKIEDNNIYIIYSQQSPIYMDINNIIKKNDKENKINYLNVCHPQIKTHPDVASKTINILLSIMNNLFYNLSEIKSKDIDCDKAIEKKIEIKAELKLTKLIIYTNNKSMNLRVYDTTLEQYKDIPLKYSVAEISLFKLKGKMISVVEIDTSIEHELVVDLKKSSLLSKIASYKNIVINGKEFSFLAIG